MDAARVRRAAARGRCLSRVGVLLAVWAACVSLGLQSCHLCSRSAQAPGAGAGPWRSPGLARAAAGNVYATAAYPELSRVEDLIVKGCNVEDGHKQQEDCLKVYDKILNLHFSAQEECEVDSLKCVVLVVLDRLCASVQGVEGLVILRQLRDAVGAFRTQYDGWEEAFEAADTDGNGVVDQDEFRVALKRLAPQLTTGSVDVIFDASDTNKDGVLQKQEFADFLLASVFAAEPLEEIGGAVDSVRTHTTEDVLRWAAKGRTPMGGKVF